MKAIKHSNCTLEFPSVLRQDPNYNKEHKVPLKIGIAEGRAHTPWGTFSLQELREAIDVFVSVQQFLESEAKTSEVEG